MDVAVLEKLKKQISDSDVLSDSEKNEWLFLLPKMSDEQLRDLEKLVSIHLSANSLPHDKGETKEGVEVEEQKPPPKPASPVHLISPISPISPIRPIGPIRPIKTEERKAPQEQKPKSVQEPSGPSLQSLKQAPSIDAYLNNLKNQMRKRVAGENSTWKKELTDYEQSPLYRAYLKAGVVLLTGEKSKDLDHEQFEALADFHSELKKAGQ